MGDVKLLATWDGWCGPCTDERPLVLTALGPRGLRAWLKGLSDEDRELRLTCRVCGRWQVVPQDEADDLVGLDEPVDDLTDEPGDEPGRPVPLAGVVAAPQRDRTVAPATIPEAPAGVAASAGPATVDLEKPVGVPRPSAAAPAVPAGGGEPDDEPFDPLLAALGQRRAPSAPSLLAGAPGTVPAPQPPLVVPALRAPAVPAQAAPVEPAPGVPLAASVPQLAPPAAGPLPSGPGPRGLSAPEGSDLATALELLSQGLEMSGPGSRPQQ